MKKLFYLFTFFTNILIAQTGLVEEYKEFIVKQYSNEIINLKDLNTISIPSISPAQEEVKYIPCVVNGVFDYFVFDTGCYAGLAINNNLFEKILRTGNVLYEDYIGDTIITTAVGSYEVVKVVIMDEVIIGLPNNSFKANNVLTVIYNSNDGPLLFGQDLINRFSSITIDNQNKVFVFKN